MYSKIMNKFFAIGKHKNKKRYFIFYDSPVLATSVRFFAIFKFFK